MRIFLSGKVDQLYGSWRDYLLGVRHEWRDNKRLELPKWEIIATKGDDYNYRGYSVSEWPILYGTVLETHDYTGPFRQTIPDINYPTKWSGYFHGIESFGSHGQMDESEKKQVVNHCKASIDKSDMVFAYINSRDCYGTLVEIGYAAARGIFVSLAIDCFEHNEDDIWFASEIANYVIYRHYEEKPDEKMFLHNALLESVSRCTTQAKKPKDKIAEAAYSLRMIRKWSSDPRVRNEAERILKNL